MHAVFTSLMAGLLFIHTVFGCCWHHAHSYGECQHALAEASQPVKCCKHDHESESKLPQKPCKGHAECQGVCTYLVPQKVQIDFPQVIAPFDLVAIPSVLTDAQIAAAARWELACCHTEIEPPLRLHLLHQTLLI